MGPWYLYQMVTQKLVAHVRSNLCRLICFRHLIKSSSASYKLPNNIRTISNISFGPISTPWECNHAWIITKFEYFAKWESFGPKKIIGQHYQDPDPILFHFSNPDPQSSLQSICVQLRIDFQLIGLQQLDPIKENGKNPGTICTNDKINKGIGGIEITNVSDPDLDALLGSASLFAKRTDTVSV